MELGGRASGNWSAIDAIIRAELEQAAAERFLALVRPSVGFRVRSDVSASGSVFGGLPRTADLFDWPQYQGRPMTLLAQIDCHEVADLLGSDWTFPQAGYLLFFHDDDFVAEFSFDHGDDGCRVMHVAAGADGLGSRGETPVLPVLSLAGAAVPSVPTWADDEADRVLGGDVMAWSRLEKALRDVAPLPRHRLLGWCDGGNPAPPKGLRPLLQLEAEAGTDWGEIVNVSFWIRDEDLRAGGTWRCPPVVRSRMIPIRPSTRAAGSWVPRQFIVDSRARRRLIRSIIARWIMASERCGWVS
ncbi:DUF1963 domain-containing protein [Yinghuangia sp. YIM S09857]|uniref:DUF1963 domain-containing protein n=1 Tax=Yinghuangia sp. YIM S09857 TaxID=3436929 RepID=UPI003F53412A